MSRMRIVARCVRCGGRKITVEKDVVFKDEKDLEQQLLKMMLCHDGYGLDLNSFTFRCADCGGEVALEVEKDAS